MSIFANKTPIDWANERCNNGRSLRLSVISDDVYALLLTLKQYISEQQGIELEDLVLIGDIAVSYHSRVRMSFSIDILLAKHVNHFADRIRDWFKHIYSPSNVELTHQTNICLNIWQAEYLHLPSYMLKKVFADAIRDQSGIYMIDLTSLIALKLYGRCTIQDQASIIDLLRASQLKNQTLDLTAYQLSQKQTTLLKKLQQEQTAEDKHCIREF